MRAAERLHARFRKSEVLHLAFADQAFDRAGDVLDRHLGIDAVLVEEIDPIGLEPLQRRVGDLAYGRWPTVQPCLLAALKSETELGCDDDTRIGIGADVPREREVNPDPLRGVIVRLGASDKSDVLLAQALGEYGGLSAILASFESAWLAAHNLITSADTSTWVVVGLIAFVLLLLWNRR